MPTTRTRLVTQLLHPATLIAVLALLVATGGTAYAIVITGAQIKDGTVTTADIKNGSLAGADVKDGSLSGFDIKNSTIGSSDLASTAKGARAVAAIWSDGVTCTIIAARSRGFTGCSRGGLGDYTLTKSATVNMNGSYPICSRGSNGGFNTLYQFSCDVGPNTATTVRLRLTRIPETGTGTPEAYDAAETVPAVVVIP